MQPLATLATGSLLRPRGPRLRWQGQKSTSSSPAEYCVDIVRKRDRETYLATLLLPAAMRRPAFALRAFNVEVSSVRDAVTEKAIGMMRLQFWRDAVAAAAAGATGGGALANPVAGELSRAMIAHNLSEDLVQRVIASRERFLSDRQFATLNDMDAYGRDAFASVNLLLLECLASVSGLNSRGGHARHAAEQLGMAQGIVTQLRATPYAAAKRAATLPADVMVEHGLSTEALFRFRTKRGGETAAAPNPPEGLTTVVEVVAARAEEHLDNCRFRSKNLSKDERLIMLPAVAVDAYLTALHRSSCDVFAPAAQRINALLPASLYWHSWKRTY